ncbi:MAG: hypothetical protein L0Y71_07185 [Gemmataceae bacterium]|nr:hypothetical protein [Gemmataceae bacterium]
MSPIIPPDDSLLPKWLSSRLNVDAPLEPGEPLYQALYEPLYTNDPDDPIQLIFQDIAFNEVQSLNFISGFRGSGKTTELFRLRKQLQDDDYFVAYANALDYVLPSEPVDISDFLIVLAGSFSDSLADQLEVDPVKESWWTRIVHYLTKTKVDLEGFDVKVGGKAAGADVGLNFKTSLKQVPSFRQKLREKMAPRLGELRNEVQKFFVDAIKLAKKKSKTEKNVVLIFDQLEQLRDALGDKAPVADSVTSLIGNHREDLQIPSVHCVYTVPPWLKFKLPGLPTRLLYNVKLCNNDDDRTRNGAGWTTMRNIVERRFTADGMRRFFGDVGPHGASPLADQLIRFSGGHFRDLLRLLRETLLRSRKLPITREIMNSAIVNLRASFLPIPVKNAFWLNEIGAKRDSLLKDTSAESIRQMTLFLDTHCVMIHRNGNEWYDVHPIIREEIEEIVKREQPAPQAPAST